MVPLICHALKRRDLQLDHAIELDSLDQMYAMVRPGHLKYMEYANPLS